LYSLSDPQPLQQVAQICKMARPKIQKWIGEAGEDNAELMGTSWTICGSVIRCFEIADFTLALILDRLLLINDLINNVLNRYQAIKAGDWAKAQEIDAT